MMVYYAVLQRRTAREYEGAVVLYSSYSLGYALGMSFRNPEGIRQMFSQPAKGAVPCLQQRTVHGLN